MTQPLFNEAQLRTPPPSPEVIAHLKAVVDEFGTATLITRQRRGGLHGRPMAIAGVDDDLDIWLITSVDSRKAREISEDGRCMLVFQGTTRFASLNGHAQLTHNREKLQELWKESFRVWYDGKLDPSIVLLRFTPIDAEYWDNSGVNGITYAFQALRAYFTGDKLAAQDVDTDLSKHAKVDLSTPEPPQRVE